MPKGPNVGYAHVTISPDLTTFGSELEAGTSPAITAAGVESGKKYSSSLSKSAATGVKDIGAGLDKAILPQVQQIGISHGKAYGLTFGRNAGSQQAASAIAKDLDTNLGTAITAVAGTHGSRYATTFGKGAIKGADAASLGFTSAVNDIMQKGLPPVAEKQAGFFTKAFGNRGGLGMQSESKNIAKAFDESLSPALGEVASREGNTFSRILSKAISPGPGAVALFGAIGLGAESVKQADELENATVILDNSLKNAKISAASFQSTLQSAYTTGEKFGFANVDIATALSKLVTATGSTTLASKALSTAEDLAALKHTSLAATSDALTKAFGGQSRGLKDLGILTPPVINQSVVLKDIVADLTAEYGNQNKAITNTQLNYDKYNLAQARVDDAQKKLAGSTGVSALSLAQLAVKQDAVTKSQDAYNKLAASGKASNEALKASQDKVTLASASANAAQAKLNGTHQVSETQVANLRVLQDAASKAQITYSNSVSDTNNIVAISDRLHITFAAAQQLVAQAELKNTDAMNKLGINTSGTAQQAAHFIALLDLMNPKLKNDASVAAETLTGKIVSMKATFKDIGAVIGGYVVPIAANLLTKLDALVGFIGSHKKEVIEFAGAVTIMAGAFSLTKLAIAGSPLLVIGAAITAITSKNNLIRATAASLVVLMLALTKTTGPIFIIPIAAAIVAITSHSDAVRATAIAIGLMSIAWLAWNVQLGTSATLLAIIDAIPIVALFVAIAAALAAIVYGIIKLVETIINHWGAIENFFLHSPIAHAIEAIFAPLFAIPILIAVAVKEIIDHWKGFVNFFTKDIPHAFDVAWAWFKRVIWDNLTKFFTKDVPGFFQAFPKAAHDAFFAAWHWFDITLHADLRHFFTIDLPGFFMVVLPKAAHDGFFAAWHWFDIVIIHGTINFFTNTIPNFFVNQLPKFAHDGFFAVWHWFDSVIIHGTENFFTNTIPNFFVNQLPQGAHDGFFAVWHWFDSIIIQGTGNFFVNTIPDFFTNKLPKAAHDGFFAVWQWFDSTIIQGIVTFFTQTLPQAAIGAFNRTVNGMIDMLNAAIHVINWVITIVGIPKIPDIPHIGGGGGGGGNTPQSAGNASGGGHTLGPGMAEGGKVPGPDTRRDSHLAWLMPGEYVIRRDAVQKVGTQFLNHLNYADKHADGGLIPAFGIGGLFNPGNWVKAGESALGDVAGAAAHIPGLNFIVGAARSGFDYAWDHSVKPLMHVLSGGTIIGGLGMQIAGEVKQFFDNILGAGDKNTKTKAASIGGGNPGPAGPNTPAGVAQGYASSQLSSFGWGSDQMPSLIRLWNQESGWNSNAVNPSSGAYGIPQALGHGHPYNLGDYVAQIQWGLNYIKGRYGSPDAAWAHEVANNWYSQGGLVSLFDEGGMWANGTLGLNTTGSSEGVLTPAAVGRVGGPHGVASLNAGGDPLGQSRIDFQPTVKVYLGNEEFKGYIDTQVESGLDSVIASLGNGRI